MQHTETKTERCYGKPLPITVNAVRIHNRYIDPRVIKIKILNLISVALMVAGVVLSCYYLI